MKTEQVTYLQKLNYIYTECKVTLFLSVFKIIFTICFAECKFSLNFAGTTRQLNNKTTKQPSNKTTKQPCT